MTKQEEKELLDQVKELNKKVEDLENVLAAGTSKSEKQFRMRDREFLRTLQPKS